MSTDEWKKRNTVVYKLRLTISSGLPDAIKRAAKDGEMQETAYIRQSLIKALEEGGYLPPTGKLPQGKVVL